MALGNDDNPNNGPASNQNPFAYVLIPVLGFGLIVAVITCYRYRRKKQRLARLASDPDYQRQLEEGRRERTQLDRGPNGVIIIAGDRGGRRGGRSRRLGLGVGVGSREEGLNELGEAPPAYTPNAPKPPSEAGAEHIELTTYSQATAEAGMSRSPPMYGEEPPSPRSRSGPAVGTTSGGSGAGDSAGSSEERREDDTRNATTGHAGDSPRASEETRGDTAGNAATATTATTATTTTTGSTTTTTPTTDEPTPPPRAVLPSS
ncbi:hypothetical protein F5B21DRAFT_391937 [Xylaria acuta]|nr:hypothetical protein F5B21DRAFT_391937 [Xylaria acuta]